MAIRGNIRSLAENIRNGKPVFLGDRHVDARHQRKMIGHVALVAVAEIGADVFRPLIGLGEQDSAAGVRIQLGSDVLNDRVGLGEILVVGSLAFAQIGNCVQTEAVDAEVDPAAHDLDHRGEHARIIVVEVRLMRKEAVPVIRACDRVPRPIRFFGVAEDDARCRIGLIGIVPDIPLARIRPRPASARAQEPRMLI